MTEERFSVCEFYSDGSYTYLKPRFISAREAMRMASHSITSVGAQIGIIQRVIVTDGGDCINFEWKYGLGVTFPQLSERRGVDEGPAQ